MVRPLLERTKFQRLALVAGLLLMVFLLDLSFAGNVDAAVWVFAIALLLSGVWLGASQARGMSVGEVASTASRRRTNFGVALAFVVGGVVALSGLLDVERTTFQDVLAVAGVGIAAFVVAFSLAVLRSLPAARSE